MVKINIYVLGSNKSLSFRCPDRQHAEEKIGDIVRYGYFNETPSGEEFYPYHIIKKIKVKE